jgi:hypothetical protein
LSITESLPTTFDLGFLLFLDESAQQQVDPQHGIFRNTRRMRLRNWNNKKMKNYALLIFVIKALAHSLYPSMSIKFWSLGTNMTLSVII